MIKRIMLTFAVAALLSSCGYDGGFRYPCQDPVNWKKAECKPPICTASQICPSDLVKLPQPEGTPNV